MQTGKRKIIDAVAMQVTKRTLEAKFWNFNYQFSGRLLRLPWLRTAIHYTSITS